MPLSPHDVEALARIGEEPRPADQELAAALSLPPPSSPSAPSALLPSIPIRHVLLLLAALAGLGARGRAVRRAVPYTIAAGLITLALVPPPAPWNGVGVWALVLLLSTLAPRLVVRVVERFERSSS